MQELDRDINPQDYAGEMSGAKGDFGEARMHDAMKNKNYEFRGSSKEPGMGKPSDKGLDGAYEKLAPAEGEPRHVAGEAKYDQATLRPGQEKWEWVDGAARQRRRTQARQPHARGGLRILGDEVQPENQARRADQALGIPSE